MIKKIKNLFGNYDINYKRLIILSILCGVIPGIFLVIPLFKNTSFWNPGTCFEFWVLSALFVILNSKNYKEAAIKTFLFLIISQPIIYLVQVPFSSLGFGIFKYYPIWFIYTLLTIPGAMIAYRTKKGDILSMIILGVALLLLNIELANHLMSLISSFPKQLITCIFIILEDILFINLLFKDNIKRIILYVFCILVFSVSLYLLNSSSVFVQSTAIVLDDKYTYEIVSYEDNLKVSLDDNILSVDGKKSESVIVLKRNDGTTINIVFECDDDSCSLDIS